MKGLQCKSSENKSVLTDLYPIKMIYGELDVYGTAKYL